MSPALWKILANIALSEGNQTQKTMCDYLTLNDQDGQPSTWTDAEI